MKPLWRDSVQAIQALLLEKRETWVVAAGVNVRSRRGLALLRWEKVLKICKLVVIIQ